MEVLEEKLLDKNFAKFGSKFQLSLLSLLIQDKLFYNKIKSIIKAEYFDNKYNQIICDIILKYSLQYHICPDFDILKSLIETQIENPKIYLTTLESIKTADLTHRTFIEEEIEKFCFTKHALDKIEEEKNNILLGKFDKAREISFSKYKSINTQVKEFDLKEDYSKLFEENINIPVPTPLPSVNMVTQGGPGPGNLIIIVAQSNFGKTSYGIATARNLIETGKNVLFISLETDGVQLLRRCVAGMIKSSQSQVSFNPSIVKKKVGDLPSNLKILEFKSIQARLENIKLKVEELKSTGFFPEMIVIDGLNQLKLPKGINYTNSNDKFEYLAEEVRDWAKEEALPIYAMFQSNRGAFNVEFADEQNIGKAIEVYQVCDVMFLFTQTIPQQELGECYVQVLKNRLGPKGLTLRLKYNPDMVTFEELESIDRSMLQDKNKRENIKQGISAFEKTLDKYKKKET